MVSSNCTLSSLLDGKTRQQHTHTPLSCGLVELHAVKPTRRQDEAVTHTHTPVLWSRRIPQCQCTLRQDEAATHTHTWQDQAAEIADCRSAMTDAQFRAALAESRSAALEERLSSATRDSTPAAALAASVCRELEAVAAAVGREAEALLRSLEDTGPRQTAGEVTAQHSDGGEEPRRERAEVAAAPAEAAVGWSVTLPPSVPEDKVAREQFRCHLLRFYVSHTVWESISFHAARSRPPASTNAPTRKHAPTSHTRARAHTHAKARTHARMHARAHTHTRTHTT